MVQCVSKVLQHGTVYFKSITTWYSVFQKYYNMVQCVSKSSYITQKMTEIERKIFYNGSITLNYSENY